MSVKLTSPVLGQDVGYIYTGNLESWLLAEGYAARDADTTPTSYAGPGVANTGAADDVPANDPTLASNREAPYFPASEDRNVTIANDATNLTKTKFPAPGFDVDPGGVSEDLPVIDAVEPNTGAAAGGDEVSISGSGFEGVTAVTFGGVAATSFEVVDDYGLLAVTPAGTAGAADVVVTNPNGSDTAVGGFTYA